MLLMLMQPLFYLYPPAFFPTASLFFALPARAPSSLFFFLGCWGRLADWLRTASFLWQPSPGLASLVLLRGGYRLLVVVLASCKLGGHFCGFFASFVCVAVWGAVLSFLSCCLFVSSLLALPLRLLSVCSLFLSLSFSNSLSNSLSLSLSLSLCLLFLHVAPRPRL